MSRLRLVIPPLAAALLAASCSSPDTLATVNNIAITRADVVALRPSYDDVASLRAEQTREDLTRLIVVHAVITAAEDQFGYQMTDAEIEDRLANPPERYETVIADADQFTDINPAAVRVSAMQSLVRDAVVPELVEADASGLGNLMSARPEEVTRSCVRHISVATEREADEVLARLGQGEPFEELVAEVSLDQVSPGGLIATAEGDCLVWLTRAGTELANLAATAPLNEPVGPVNANGEWNVIVVEDRLAPASVAELTATPMEFLNPDYVSALYTPWANDALRSAEIDVSPTVGRWSEAGVGIAPPGE